MEIITKEIIQKLRNELVVEFEPIGLQLRKEGCNDRTIIRALEAHKQAKIKRFYKPLEENMFQRSLNELAAKADSKAEFVFHELLRKAKIPFEFQVKIGKYRVDFVIADYLIFEGEGPCHILTGDYDKKRDEYLTGLGFKVFRISWELVAQLPSRIIDVIKTDLKACKMI